MTHVFIVPIPPEYLLRLKSKMELIAYFERKLTMRRQNLAATLIQREFRVYLGKIYAVRAQFRRYVEAAVTIQRYFRARKTLKEERKRH